MTETTKPEMEAALARQRSAFDASLPVSAAERIDRIDRVAQLLRTHADALSKAVSDDFGHRSHEQTLLTDIAATMRVAKHARRHVARWMRPERRPLEFPLALLGASARVEYQPKGVVGIIAPWNFPIQLTLGPLIGVFGAGNRAMIKMSEFTPLTSALLKRLLEESFSPDEVAVAEGGAEVGAAFSALPFDHLIFTGATSIGRHILHAAADNLVPVTLELGGKSPVIVSPTANLGQAAERIVAGKMLNAGQICLAPDYVMVGDGQHDALVDALARAAATLYPRPLANPDYTSIVNARHHARLTGLLDDARSKGARVIEVNPADEDFKASNANKMPLHLVLEPTADMAVMQEEIFGPVLPVVKVADVDAAIARVNAGPRPLGLYYFGSHASEERRILDRTVSGGVTVNDVVYHVSMEDLPFGGIGPSGMGSYHGVDGFRTFSHAKAVYRQPKIDVAKLIGAKPPYGTRLQNTLQREMR